MYILNTIFKIQKVCQLRNKLQTKKGDLFKKFKSKNINSQLDVGISENPVIDFKTIKFSRLNCVETLKF